MEIFNLLQEECYIYIILYINNFIYDMESYWLCIRYYILSSLGHNSNKISNRNRIFMLLIDLING